MTLHDVGHHNRVPVTPRGDHSREPVTAPKRASTTHTGTVKWFDPLKGYGFIVPDAGGRDVHVHQVQLVASNMPTLAEGQPVQYEIGPSSKGRTGAHNIRPAPAR